MNAFTLRKLESAMVVTDRVSKPLVVLIPYEQFLTIQKLCQWAAERMSL
jgi:hypothetical protein